MKKFALLLLLSAMALWAADFWQTKPFTDWDAKEIQKILTDSPWARKVFVPLPGGGPGGPQSLGGGGGGGRGGGVRGGPQGPNADPGIAGGGGIAESSGRGGFGAGGGGAESNPAFTPALALLVICQSALPVKQAAVKAKFGAEAATAPDAKVFLERQEMSYVFSVSGLPGYVQPRDNEAKGMLLKQTSLTAKGKEPVTATDVQFQTNGKNVDAYFVFPRTNPFTVADKEVEFVTKAGFIAVKQKFNLKNMVVNGKLEM